MKALILIDIQNDFLPGGSLEVAKGDEIIPLINELIPSYSLVVATQDWHPKDHQSFASQHSNTRVFDVIDLNGISQVLWPDHCVQGTRGAALSDELITHRVEAIFRKGTHKNIDSYSGFYDNQQKNNTGLAGYLRDKEVTEVHLCGLAADFCVYYTAMDALKLGFKTAIVSKGTKAIDKADYMNKKELFIRQGGYFI